MDYWHEIVKSYDDPKSKDPMMKKNDGTYSQSSVVILLIYLTFGKDYPSHIAEYFKELIFKTLHPNAEMRYSSNLRTSKVGTLLNKMREDELVTVMQNKARVNPIKTYSINPRIIQSPVKGGTYFMRMNYFKDLPFFGSRNHSKTGISVKRDASPFEIPLEMIEQFLPWIYLPCEVQKDQSVREYFFKNVVYPDEIDFRFFLRILQVLANKQNEDIESNRSHYKESNSFEKLLEYYYEEIEYHRDAMIIDDCVSRLLRPSKSRKKPV